MLTSPLTLYSKVFSWGIIVHIYENCARSFNEYEIPWRHRLCAGRLPSRTGGEQRKSGSLHICLKFFILLNSLYKRLWTCRHGWLSKLIEARIATVGGWTSPHTQYGPRSVHSSTAHSQESMFFSGRYNNDFFKQTTKDNWEQTKQKLAAFLITDGRYEVIDNSQVAGSLTEIEIQVWVSYFTTRLRNLCYKNLSITAFVQLLWYEWVFCLYCL